MHLLVVLSLTTSITGGTPESGYPAVFALAYQGQGGCTGTCITPRIGLTAKHCVEGDAATDFSALFGATEESPTKTIDVIAMAVEPTSDIAIVAFADACPAFIPYNRAPLESHVGDPVVMVGFGVTTENANDAGIKRSGTAVLSSVSPAQTMGLEAGELATSNEPDGTCNGDSGGPTFMTFAGEERIIGTTSRGSLRTATEEWPCGQGESIAVRTDSYAEFIEAFIAEHDPASANPDPIEPGEDDGGDTLPDDEDEEDMGTSPTMGGGCATGGTPGLLVMGLLALVRRRRR